MHKTRRIRLAISGLLVLLVLPVILASFPAPDRGGGALIKQEFNGERAWRDVEYQVTLGPRLPDSQAHAQAVEWMVSELEQAGWQVRIQETQWMDRPVRNVVAHWGTGSPWLVLGAHYDSRMLADHDPDLSRRSRPVPGANDGASGVAVLLEMARVLPAYMKEARFKRVELVFFDSEDQGRLPGWDWILGSRAYVAGLDQGSSLPDAAVIVDMIGDAGLNIYMEKNSDPTLTAEIWQQAAGLGLQDKFIGQYRHQMLDDHIPFKEAGIPAVDLIDFDYPYWHTTADTADKVSAESLAAVGKVLLAWMTKK